MPHECFFVFGALKGKCCMLQLYFVLPKGEGGGRRRTSRVLWLMKCVGMKFVLPIC